MPKQDLDPIDCRIIAACRPTAGSPMSSWPTAPASPNRLAFVAWLEQDGAIEGYRAVLGRERIGLGFTAFVA